MNTWIRTVEVGNYIKIIFSSSVVWSTDQPTVLILQSSRPQINFCGLYKEFYTIKVRLPEQPSVFRYLENKTKKTKMIISSAHPEFSYSPGTFILKFKCITTKVYLKTEISEPGPLLPFICNTTVNKLRISEFQRTIYVQKYLFFISK